MNLDLKTIPQKIGPLLQTAKKYMTLMFILFFLAVYGFLVFRINSLAASEPSEDAIAEKLTRVKRPKIDKQAAEHMEQMEDQNVQIQTLFDKARNNPFAE